MPRFPPLFRRFLSADFSVNQQNAIMIAMETRISSLEQREIGEWASRKLRLDRHWIIQWAARWVLAAQVGRRLDKRQQENLKRWVRKFREASRFTPHGSERHHRRVRTARSYSLFQATGSPARNLLVAWSGRANRLLMPPSNYLPFLEQMDMDLLVIRPNANRNYKTGVSGFGATLPEAVAGLRDWLKASDYSRVSVLGTSGGTLPAIYSSISWKADRCVLAGLSDPRVADFGIDWRQVVSLWQSLGVSERPKFFYTDGEHAEKDCTASQFVSSLMGGQLIRVNGAGHNSLHPLWAKNLLGAWLSWVFEADNEDLPESLSTELNLNAV